VVSFLLSDLAAAGVYEGLLAVHSSPHLGPKWVPASSTAHNCHSKCPKHHSIKHQCFLLLHLLSIKGSPQHQVLVPQHCTKPATKEATKQVSK
jgi:hypothetical protein